MGTSGLTIIMDEQNEPITMLYFQSDGYPSGFGIITAGSADKKIINGYSLEQNNSNFANGMECLTAQIIKTLKDHIGGVYVMNPNKFSITYNYIYFVCFDKFGKKPYIKFYEWNSDKDDKNMKIEDAFLNAEKFSIPEFIKTFSE